MGIDRLRQIIAAVIVPLISLGVVAMPSSFYTAMGQIPNLDVICVKNYQAGASITEAYGNFEYLDKDTELVSRTYNTTEDCKEDCGEDCTRRAILEASMSSEVIGQAHLAWQSMDPIPQSNTHRALIGRSVQDLTGVFSIEKFIQLWSNSTAANSTSVEWLSCL